MSIERVEVPLGKNSGVKVFETFQELEEWLKVERAFWSWLDLEPRSEPKQAVSSRYHEFFNNLTTHITEAKRTIQQAEQATPKQEPKLKNNLENIKTTFVRYFSERSLFHSGTPFAKFIAQVRTAEGDSVAAAASAFGMQVQTNFQQVDSLRGAMVAFTFLTGLRERVPNETDALGQLRAEWEKKFQTFRDALQRETETHIKLNSDSGGLLNKQNTDFGELLKKQESAVTELIANFRTQWNDLKKTYDDSLALRSPVTYWTKKAKSHFWLSWAYAVVAAIAAGLSITFLAPEIKTMMEVPKGVTEPEKWHPEYWRIAIMIASALFCVWVIRILVRLLLSNIHLQTDAKERVTMVQTYLALMRRGKLKDDERMFILQTLFRPTPTGIVKDDAVPLTIVEGITKLRG